MSSTVDAAEAPRVVRPRRRARPIGDGGADLAPLEGPLRTTWLVGHGLLAVQFLILLGLSAFMYRRFTAAIDASIFTQAWTEIGSGNLNPQTTTMDHTFIRSHMELAMWLLALLRPVLRSPFVLSVVQDLSLVVTGVVVLRWVTSMVRRNGTPQRWSVAICAITVLLLVVNPLTYAVAATDFHFEPPAMCFAVLAAYDLWAGRARRMWLWLALCLLCGDIGGLYAAGVGISGVLASRRTRRAGLGLLAAGVGWVFLATATGSNQGSHISDGYAHLAHREVLPKGAAGLLVLAGGVLSDPWKPVTTLASRAGTIFGHLQAGGLVGVLTPWGIGCSAVSILTAALQRSDVFIRHPFQVVVSAPFVTFGSAWLIALVLRRIRTRVAVPLAVALAVVVVGSALHGAVQDLPHTLEHNATLGPVSADQADALQDALDLVPDDAQVLASVPIMGRFGARRWINQIVTAHTGEQSNEIPIHASTVFVVIDERNALPLFPPDAQQAMIARLLADGAEIVVQRDGVTALRWHPDPDQRTLTID